MSKNLSAIKRVKISLRNRIRNKKYKLAIKKSVKKYLLDIKINNLDNIYINLSSIYTKIDKAVKKGIIHKNKAARQKSRLLKKINIKQ